MSITSNLEKVLKGCIIAGSLVVLGACAGKIQRTELPANANLAEETKRLDESVNAAYNNHVDLLAPEAFEKAEEYRHEAKEELADGDDREDVIESLSYAFAYLDNAEDIAENRREQLSGVLAARTAALKAGARKYPEESKKLSELDDKIKKASDSIREDLDPGDIASLQRDYILVETSAIRTRELWTARNNISNAKKMGAKNRAPATLRKAEIALNTAENLVKVNPHNPEAYQEAVDGAHFNSQFLVDVVEASRSHGDRVSETVAIQLVQQQRELSEQDRRISGLSEDLDSTQSSLVGASQTAEQSRAALEAQRQKLSEQSKAIALQQALDQARKEFSDDEADVYQKGDQLVIRLKSLNFASGKADLPAESIDLLAKVDRVIETLNAKDIVVEGHTDSTGGFKINQKLSQQRAETVADFIEQNVDKEADIDVVGKGFSEPLATNKSKEGRAQNRRVDLILTAGAPSNIEMEDRRPASTDRESDRQPTSNNNRMDNSKDKNHPLNEEDISE